MEHNNVIQSIQDDKTINKLLMHSSFYNEKDELDYGEFMAKQNRRDNDLVTLPIVVSGKKVGEAKTSKDTYIKILKEQKNKLRNDLKQKEKELDFEKGSKSFIRKNRKRKVNKKNREKLSDISCILCWITILVLYIVFCYLYLL